MSTILTVNFLSTVYIQGGAIKVDTSRKSEVAQRLAANYDSLPSVVCDDFFNSYTNCLFKSSTLNSNPSTANNPAALQQQQQKPSRRKIRIACKISEMDGGRQLIRRHLSKVKEEESDEEEEDCINYQCSMPDDPLNDDRESPKKSSGDESNGDDFHMFLRSQMSGRTGRSRVQIYQGSSANSRKQIEQQSSSSWPSLSSGQPEEPKCYELFCVHQANLLVHRSQILVEAELLAHRLAELVAD